MYEALSTLVGYAGKSWARRLARTAIHASGAVDALSCRFKREQSANPPLQRMAMGLLFPSPLGLAAGFDRDGTLHPFLAGLGFGFSEIGTVTPRPEAERSPGLAAVITNLKQRSIPRRIPLGISISMNRDTPPPRMTQDFMVGLREVWSYADYITLNLGTRAGPDLHQPQHTQTLQQILTAAKDMQAQLARHSGSYRPVAVKIDSARGHTGALLDCVLSFEFDGLILVDREEKISADMMLLEQVAQRLPAHTILIAAGGIHTPQQAQMRLAAGAKLLQIYSGLVASGPSLVHRINRYLVDHR